jgi:hypothetical protein
MAKSIINADTDGLKQTGGDTAELELQVNGTTAITINSAGYWVLANALPITSGGTGSTTATFSGENITSLNASNISSGTLAVAQGGTGSNTATFSGANITSLNASSISSGTIANARTTASSSNGASTIVQRDASGDFSTNVITANSYSGSGANLTSLNASSISSGVIGNAYTTASSSNGANTIVQRDASGNFTANVITADGSSITSINAANISSGTLGVARGGTGAATLDANNVILGNGTSAVQFVAPGTNGNVLTSNGTTWTSAAAGGGGGSFVFLGSATASNSVVDFTGLDTSTYNSFFISYTDVRANGFNCRLYPNGVIATTGIYGYGNTALTNTAFNTNTFLYGATSIPIDGLNASSANLGRTGYLYLYPAGGYSNIISQNTGISGATSAQGSYAFGYVNNTNAANGIRFLNTSAGNLTAGNFFLYGIKSS